MKGKRILNQAGWIIRALLATVMMFVMAGCSSPAKVSHHAVAVKPLKNPINLANKPLVQKRLKAQYKVWKGTPYQFGGSTLKGVDCSAFVQNTYRNAFGYGITRTTRTQIKQGKAVSKSKLKPGDIVFFKITSSTLHNGVYLGNNQFIHASTSRGVIISTLDNVYWKRTYLTARRLR